MAGFIQIIEYKTSRPDEVNALVDEDEDNREQGNSTRGRMTADRDRPGYYMVIVEFDSYEAAMENSNRPETGEFAAKMSKLCDEPAKFYNLDVQYTWER